MECMVVARKSVLVACALTALAGSAYGQACGYTIDWVWYFDASGQLTAPTQYLSSASWNGWQPCLEYVVSEPPPYNWQRVSFQQISGPAPIFSYAEAGGFRTVATA